MKLSTILWPITQRQEVQDCFFEKYAFRNIRIKQSWKEKQLLDKGWTIYK